MAKIFGAFVIALILAFPVKLSARDYKTHFFVSIALSDKNYTLDGSNKGPELIPITDSLKAKGWKCELLPRQLLNGIEYGQAINCINTINGDAVGTFAHCSAGQDSKNETMFVLDHSDAAVKSANFSISCTTVSSEMI